MYINKISIPPKKIRKREYENQNVFVKVPVNKEIMIVWHINKIPIESGWFIKKNKKEEIVNNNKIKFWVISDSENSLLKILILGINEELFYSFLIFKKIGFLFSIYKTDVFIKLFKY